MKYKFLRHKVFVNWVTPFVITALIFSLVRPAFAEIFEQDINLAQYLATNSLEVGSETVDGYQQVYYIFNGSKTFITSSSQNSTQAVSDGEYIAYSTAVNGAGQIFLYHVPSNTTAQITSSGTNLQPRLSNGKIVWEGWTEDKWQVFLFDGTSVRQLTSGSLSINPDIEDDQVVWASNNEQDEWRTLSYSLGSNFGVVIKEGLVARYPKFRNKQVVFEVEEFLAAKEAQKQAEEEARRLAAEEATLAEEAPLAEEATFAEEISVAGQGSTLEEPAVPEDAVVIEEVPTEPQIITEEEIIAELEGEPLVEQELTEEEAAALEEEPAPVQEQEPELAPVPEQESSNEVNEVEEQSAEEEIPAAEPESAEEPAHEPELQLEPASPPLQEPEP